MKPCHLPVNPFVIDGQVLNPVELAVYPQIRRIGFFTAEINYALVNVFISATADANGTIGVFLVLNSAPVLSVSRACGILSGQISRPTPGTASSLEDFLDFRDFAIKISQGAQIGLYASYSGFGDRIYASANLQLKPIS